jgi:hypothetical protein
MIGVLALGISSCSLMPQGDETKTSDETEMIIDELLSDDDSLETIDAEMQDTELDDFDAELDALDDEINNL